MGTSNVKIFLGISQICEPAIAFGNQPTNGACIINPRRAIAARVIYSTVCVCVSAQICRLTHWNHKKEILTDSSQYGNDFKSDDFCKIVLFKSYGVIYSPRAAPAVIFNEITFYDSFEADSYVFTLQTTGLWKAACDSLAQTRERHRYTDHEY